MWHYDHLDETKESLLSQGIIDLGGEIDDNMAMYVREALMVLTARNSPEIKIIITSDGGHIKAGLAIYDMLKRYNGRKVGLVNCFCRSVATVILQACTWRQASSHADIKIHNVAVSWADLGDLRRPKKLAALIKALEKDQSSLNLIYSQRTGKNLIAVNRQSDNGQSMTAQEALSFGLIDEVLD